MKLRYKLVLEVSLFLALTLPAWVGCSRAQPAGVDPTELNDLRHWIGNGLRGAAVGRLHDETLGALLEDPPPFSTEPTIHEIDGLLRAAREELLARTDFAELARRMDVGEDVARQIVEVATEDTVKGMIRLTQVIGGCIPELEPVPTLVCDWRELLMALPWQLAAEGTISTDFAAELSEITSTAYDAGDRGVGDFISDVEHRLGGNRWEGNDRVAADAFLSVAKSSSRLWREGGDGWGEDTPRPDGYHDPAKWDAVGASIGGLLGGIGALTATLLLVPASGGLSAAAGATAVGAGAAAGAGFAGAAASAGAMLSTAALF